MARKPTFGTPNQSKAYLFPNRRRGRLLACWAGVAIVAAALAVDAFTTRSLLVSPGILSKSHALVRSQDASSSDCARCHSPFSAPRDDRCVGCHEPRAAVSRFANQAHTEQIQAADRGTTGAKHPARPPACIICHTEHQGRAARIEIVANSACRSCHGFRSLGSGHPEFGILRLGRPEAPGMKFNHKRHLEELAKKNLQPPQACETCHHPNAGRTEFASISFDRDCSACHFQDKGTIGVTASLTPEMIVTVEAISASDPSVSWTREYADDFDQKRSGLVKKTIRHRDAWIRYNVERLAAAIEGASSGAAGSRPPQAELDLKVAALKSELDDLNRQRTEASSAQDPETSRRRLSDLEARISRLTPDIAGLRSKIAEGSPDTTPAPAPPPASDQVRASLAEIDEILSLLSSRKEGWAHEEGERLRARRAQIASHSDQTGPGWSSAGLAARRGEIDRRLDVLAREGAPASTISTLRRDLETIGAAASSSAPASQASVPSSALQPSLAGLDAAIDVLGARAEPWAKDEADRLRAKRNLLASRDQEPSPGWSPEMLARRRAEISGLLDALSRGGAPQSQTAALRRELDGIVTPAASTSGVVALRSQLDGKERALASAKEESERLQSLLQRPPGAASTDAASLDQRRAQIEGEIHALQDLPRAPAPAASSSLDPEEATKTIDKMLKPCMHCHLEANHTIGRTAAARPVLPASIFNHKPHLQQATCLDCHGKISASEDAADLGLDGIAKCQSCHRWRGAAATCQTCHRYHPKPVEAAVAGMDLAASTAGPS